MNPAPYFSVITPSFNQGPFLEGAIQSVLAQGDPDFEHLVLDNCSTDGTREVLARHPHLRTRIEPDSGQSDALNKGFREARGEVICWLNADDEYLPGAFAAVRRAMSEPGVDVVFGEAEEVFFDGRPPVIRQPRFERREDLLFWWEKRVDLLQPAVFFRRRLVEEAGPLREDLHFVMDAEFWWRISAGHPFHHLPVPLARQLRQPDSKTVKNGERIYLEKARVFEPLLHAAYPQRRFSHILARRRRMGRRYLSLAQFTGPARRDAARELLRLAVRENPLLLLTSAWWKTRLHLRFGSARPAAPHPPASP